MILPDSMTAIEIPRPGGPEALMPSTRPVPRPASGDVLVKVAAAGVNRPDCLQRAGNYPPPPGASDIPGLEIAGTVVALGDGVGDLAIGDTVTALVAGGGYAEYCTAPVRQCLPIPDGFDTIQAAALPETYFTVWSNVFDRGGLQAGEKFLVHGGSSGIGTTAIQLAAAKGARVFATAGSAEKCEVCGELGAERAINYREEDWLSVIKGEPIGGVDLILDMVGGDYTARNIKALSADGRLVNIAWLRGSRMELDLMAVMLKRLTLTGSTLRARSVAVKGDIATKLRAEAWPLLASGKIRPLIHQTFALTQAAAAHALMESNAHIGKIVLTV